MAYLEWREQYEVGVPAIDEQHRIIFELINDLHDGVNAGRGRAILRRTIQGLVSYAAIHFNMEEEVMRRENYPGLSGHLAEHTAFVQRVGEFQKQFGHGDEAAAGLLSGFLKGWLTDHILKVDTKLADFLRTRPMINNA